MAILREADWLDYPTAIPRLRYEKYIILKDGGFIF